MLKKFWWALALFCSMALAPPAEARRPVLAYPSMAGFVHAVVTRNPTLFLTYVSRSRGLRWVNTIPMSGPPSSHAETHSYATLAHSFRTHGEYYEQYFESSKGTEGGELFFDKIKRIGMTGWTKMVAEGFYRPDDGAYVKWRREAGHWVISELGYPAS